MSRGNYEYLKALAGEAEDPKIDDERLGINARLLKKIYEQGGAGGGSKLDIVILDELPETGEKGILYLIPKAGTQSEEGIYNKYVWVESSSNFIMLGDTHVEVDVANYVQKTAFVYDDETETLNITIE